MSEVLTKENFDKFIEYKKLEMQVNDKCNEILKLISIEINSVFDKIRGNYMLGINLGKDNKIVISIKLNGIDVDPVTCGYDILYDEPARIIALRDIKDVLYEVRKKIQNKKKKSLLQRFFEWL